jgi:2-oxoglutarate ferredoxin oxidoreductase subunit delta
MRIFCFLFVVDAERNVAIRIVFIRLFIIFVSNLTILGVMAKIKGTIVVDKERCKGCGVCASACPCDVLALSAEVNSKGYPVAWMVNPDSCTGCASCAVICPDSCITVYRQKFE